MFASDLLVSMSKQKYDAILLLFQEGFPLHPIASMARKKRKSNINKSQAIRDFVTENPGVGPTEAAAKLTESLGVKITPGNVSTVKFQMSKSGSGKSPAKKRGGGRRTIANGQVSFDEMLAAKELVTKLGGVDQAQRALAALAQLQQ